MSQCQTKFSQSKLMKCIFQKTIIWVKTLIFSVQQPITDQSDFQTWSVTLVLGMIGGLVFWEDWELPLVYAQLNLHPQTLFAGVAIKELCGEKSQKQIEKTSSNHLWVLHQGKNPA